MDPRLKQRLIGAAVLVALAVIFLPMLVQGPAPDSGVSDVPLAMPDAPRGEYETRDLPLVTPGNAPVGGAVGMRSALPAASSTATPATATVAPAAAAVTQPATTPQADATSDRHPVASANDVSTHALPVPLTDTAQPLPPTSAAGDYAVSFGTYATPAAADAVLASLRAAQLPARRELSTINGTPAWRVRIGPYASRADAETARLRAAHVRDDVGARVVVLDAEPAAPTAGPRDASKPNPAAGPATPVVANRAPTAIADTAVAKPAAATTGFTIQLAAYSKPDEATALRDKLRAAGFTAFTETVDTDKGKLTRVRVGPVITHAEADQVKAQIKAKVGLDGVVRPYP